MLVPAFHSLFSGTPPFGMPTVNPTIPTWGTDDDGRKPYVLSNATLHNSGYVGSDNAIGSPDYFIDYADPKGPNESHQWLQEHPFY